MAWDFTVDSEKQRELAKQLENNSNNYDEKVNDMYTKINNMGDSWTGEDYDMFKSGTDGYRPALKDLSDGIRMYATHLNKVADGTEVLAKELADIIENMTRTNQF